MKPLFIVLLIILLSISGLAILEQTEVIDTDAILSYILPPNIKTQIDSLDHHSYCLLISLVLFQFVQGRIQI